MTQQPRGRIPIDSSFPVWFPHLNPLWRKRATLNYPFCCRIPCQDILSQPKPGRASHISGPISRVMFYICLNDCPFPIPYKSGDNKFARRPSFRYFGPLCLPLTGPSFPASSSMPPAEAVGFWNPRRSKVKIYPEGYSGFIQIESFSHWFGPSQQAIAQPQPSSSSSPCRLLGWNERWWTHRQSPMAAYGLVGQTASFTECDSITAI